MQIVSGAMGKERIHFEAPPSADVPELMAGFIEWFNKIAGLGGDGKFPPVRAALAHLWFESIHPFEDGNGRIGRAIAEKALSQGLGAPVPFSLSRAIESDKKAYYHALEHAQRSNEVTAWLEYFVPMTLVALNKAEKEIVFIVRKAKFFDRFRDTLNDRHLKALRRMLEAGPDGLQGGMNARKYSGITGASKATATRDLQYLRQIGAMVAVGGGRSTRYELCLESG
jgi:Fic family protein